MGPWFGFLTGMLESTLSLLLSSLGIWYISEIVIVQFHYEITHKLEVCIPFIVGILIFNYLQETLTVSWIYSTIAAVTVIVIWIIFVCGTSPQVHFDKYASTRGQEHSFLMVSDGISIAVWYFASLSAIPTISHNIATVSAVVLPMFIV